VQVSFTASERIRREVGMHFGQYPSLAEGVFLRTWRPTEEQPKIPSAVRTMMARGLVNIRNTERGPGAFFTEARLEELRRLLLDRRYMERDPELRKERAARPHISRSVETISRRFASIRWSPGPLKRTISSKSGGDPQ